MLEFSPTQAATARGCWMKYKWKCIDKIEPIRQPSSLSIGKVIHKAFELFYRGSTDQECLAYIIKSFDDQKSKSELSDQEDVSLAKATACGMWMSYPHKRLDDFEEILPEVPFSVKLVPGVRLRGIVDGLVKKDGKLWVREVKTTGLDSNQLAGRFRTSNQATSYVYGVRKMGINVEGVMYDVIKRHRLRKRQTEDADEFGQRIIGDYKWNPEFYYTRHWEYRSSEEIALFEADSINFAKELRRRKLKNLWYRNTDQCWNFNSECPYLKICFQEQPDKLTLELLYRPVKSREEEDNENQG